MDNKDIQQLLNYGFSLIPIKPREKIAAIAWREFQDRHAKPEEITVWQNQGSANFGVVTGRISGIIVVDIDNQDAMATVEKLGVPLGTPVVSTGKGAHLYFAYPKDLALELGKIKTGVNIGKVQGLDLRADGGYVLAPGCVHPSGRVYEWHSAPPDPLDPQAFPPFFPPIPKWLEVMLTTKGIAENRKESETGHDLPGGVQDLGLGGAISEGGRNHAMTRIAGALRQRGRSRREILERLRSENERCQPPLADIELMNIADSVSKYDQEIGDYHLTESGNAQRMIDLYGNDIIYSTEHGRWFIWNGAYWSIDSGNEILKFAQKTAFSIYDDCDRASDDKVKKLLFKFANESEQLKKLKAMVEIAKAHHFVNGKSMDRDTWLLNCPNGMVDLRTGELLPHDRKQFITKVSGTEFHVNAECPRWLQFLDEITDGDGDLQEYLQRIAGYSLTGETSEHVWFLMLGNGRNGKSTFLNAMQNMMGGYAQIIRPEALLMQGMDRVPNDLAALKGARFVASSETPASRKLNESLIKQLTGGDTIQARFLHKEFFEFQPQCKLLLATNYRPNIQGTDIGIWRRTHEVPFPASIPESRVDPNLHNKLEEELPGILAWAVRGCQDWQRHRLRPPKAVQMARAEYYEEMDTVGQFLKEWCMVDPMPAKSTATEATKHLYRAFVAWCMDNSEDVLTKKAFGMKLAQRNIPNCRMSDGGRGRQGIRLIAHEIDNPMGRGTQWKLERG